MKKILLLCFITVSACQTIYASEIGLGVAIHGPRYSINIPIAVSQDYRVEGYMSYYGTKSDDGGHVSEDLHYEVGAGIFKLLQENRHTLYYGARLGLADDERKISYSSTVLVGGGGAIATVENTDTNLKGYVVAPVVGFEYSMTDHISIGGEISYFYQYLKGVVTTSNAIGTSFPDTNANQTYQGTTTRVLLRYYF